MASAPTIAPQRVRKMLLLGLGSTGTDICEALGERLIQEFGGLERVPWIQFLCLETNQSAGKLMPERGDLLTLCIQQQDYRGNLASPGALQQAIQFQTWADMATLNNIGDITTGAGNIRMAGRLAFLYPSNFANFLKAFNARYEKLQRLTPIEAQQARGLLPGGDNPPLQFIGNQTAVPGATQHDDITVVVVGTLCGGTSSGIAVDMGYFIEKYAPHSRRLALFSLPRYDLDVADFELAERYKKNAYSALKELYHFSQIGTNSYPVKYPTDPVPCDRNQCYSYDLVLLAWPDTKSRAGEARLNLAIAERLFANAFCPEADPFVAGVDGAANKAYGPNNDRHTLFCTFGLSVLEFPAPRLVEYGAARLLHRSLSPWLERQTDRVAIEAEVAACGVDYDHLKATLLAQDPGLTSLLQTRVAEVVEKAKADPPSFSLGLSQLQAGFGDQTGAGEHLSLAQGDVPQRLQKAAGACVNQAWTQIRDRVKGYLQDWQKGPRYAIDFLSETETRLAGARDGLLGLMSAEAGSPGSTAHLLQELRDDFCVRALFLKNRALNDAGEALRDELSRYVQARLDGVVAQVMASGRDIRGLPVPGVLEILEGRIDVLRRRLGNLSTALAQYATAMETRAKGLAVPPAVNGICLMDDETADRVYGQLLAPNGDAEALAKAERARGAALFTAFAAVGAKIAEIDQPSDWDLAASPNAGLGALPSEDRAAIEPAARQPFQSLLSRNVFAEWSAAADPNGLAQECVRAADLRLSPDNMRAQQLRGTPLHSVNLLIRPTANSQAFDRAVGAGHAWKPMTGSEPTRALFLREVYCIPPESLRGITSTADHVHALETATFDGYYTFTRKDVSWGPMSEGEWLRLEKYEQLLAIALQIGRVKVAGGILRIEDYPREGMGDPPHRKISAHFPEAVRQWALIGMDNENLDLGKLESTLTGAISSRIRQQGGEQFVGRLSEGLMYPPEGITGWDTERIGELLSRFCVEDTILKPYYDLLFQPRPEVLEALWCEAGHEGVTGRPAKAAGLYCIVPHCGGEMAKNKLEAAHAAWKCPVCNHDYSSRGQVDSEWLRAAMSRKPNTTPGPPEAHLENGKVSVGTSPFQGMRTA